MGSNGGGVTNEVISRVAFSPTCIWVTPSSQPKHTRGQRRQREKGKPVDWLGHFTLDDLADTNLGVEVTAADRRVKPGRVLAESGRFPGRAGLDVTPLGRGERERGAGGQGDAYFLPLLSCKFPKVKKSARHSVFSGRSLSYTRPRGHRPGGRV